MINIKVLGSGCANCVNLEKAVRQAAQAKGIDAKIEKITNYAEIMKYSVLSTPGLVVGERVVSSGRIPTAVEIEGWLEAAERS